MKRMKSNNKVAFIYDFDGTLAPGNMQEFGFMKAIGGDKAKFWEESDRLSKENDASGILCYMYLMIKTAKYHNISLKRESFRNFGKEIKFFNGVKKWFSLVNDMGKNKGLEIVHYINSSGLKEMIEGTEIANEFERIYASSFLYDVDHRAFWPAVAIDFTTKTQFLFKINKGIKEVSDDKKINQYIPEEERAVPFKHMIYFGDGTTDIPCMKMVKQNGGHSIAVYEPGDKQKKECAEKLIKENRVNFVCPADYSYNKEMYNVVSRILEKIRVDIDFNELLRIHRNK